MVNTHEKNGYLTQFVQIIEAEDIFLTEVRRFVPLSLPCRNIRVARRPWLGGYNRGADTNRHQMQAAFFHQGATSTAAADGVVFNANLQQQKKNLQEQLFFYTVSFN
ncbi:hypothetical protein [Herbaspirillum rhizosphaerae]|uniref:hypothetical protein n=1 Tax=Herbaspirillum rhizosphaerae TaxID=346179 RepID=UPI00067C66E0|nr:hypothetical protein [Herbaspirillum rhizosphaerae]